jgi:toxin ParE1/3/4
MKLLFSTRFRKELQNVISFIQYDNKYNAIKFYDDIMDNLKLIPDMPFAYRVSSKYNDKNVREMIFKKYTIIFQITTKNIIILGIFNQNLWNTK